MPIGAIIGGGLGLLGGIIGGNSAESAARTQAAAQERAAQLAAEEARFRPIGVTTRFGQSQFQTDAEGRVTGAGYTLDPALRAYQDRFMNLAGGGLTQAEQAQQQFAPLGAGAQSLFNLGQGYLAQSPQEAAQQYMARQQELLAPGRERQLAGVQNSLFNTGRQGLAVGATSGPGGLGAASPEMEAYYNALAQQDAQLAANAMQAGQQQATFGAGLLGTGGNLLTQQYGGQAAALTPYEAYLRQMQTIEGLGQQPLDIGINIGAQGKNPTGANALLQGGMASAATMGQANAYNPFATALTQGAQNQTFTNALGRLFSGSGGGRAGDFSSNMQEFGI